MLIFAVDESADFAPTFAEALKDLLPSLFQDVATAHQEVFHQTESNQRDCLK